MQTSLKKVKHSIRKYFKRSNWQIKTILTHFWLECISTEVINTKEKGYTKQWVNWKIMNKTVQSESNRTTKSTETFLPNGLKREKKEGIEKKCMNRMCVTSKDAKITMFRSNRELTSFFYPKFKRLDKLMMHLRFSNSLLFELRIKWKKNLILTL